MSTHPFPLRGRLMGCLALSLAAAPALAGGIDLSGQDVSPLFQDGRYAELSFGLVMPSVSGSYLGLVNSGKVAPAYTRFGGAIKQDFGTRFSGALIFDQPWGAAIEYPTGTLYPLAGSSAHVTSSSVTALGRFKIDDHFSVHAGLRYITASGDVALPFAPYASTYASDSDLSYVVGGAYERPDIALRVAVTYATATSYALKGSLTDATAQMPQSVNLDFQTGIAANTLVFGQVRWANWADASITAVGLPIALLSYNSDVVDYSVGVGRKFNDRFSGAITLGYEGPTNQPVSNLAPTDGYLSVGIGGTYTRGNMKITGGVAQYWLGDATTESIGAFSGGTFSGNTALGVGVKVGFSF